MTTIIFDFDGTLADSMPLFMQAWNTYAGQFNYLPVSEKDLAASRNLTIQQRAKKYGFPMHKIPVILPKVYQYFKAHMNEVALFDGIKDMLDALAHNGYRIVIISSNAKENIELFLKQEGIETVSQVLTSSRIFGKDTVIRKYMKQQNVSAEQLLYVGDEVRDIVACNKVAVPFAWVSWGLDGFELIEKERPKFVVHSPQELLDALIAE
ncbi:HAD family hydrolase [Planococcus glaciei]|uniref:HAD-IA family hydrolase n=1 Tax=Planococcus glaciei TaxID=459472 RepID=UPI00069D664E|nr:HAD-IA family hydrolase [Planococcus glaciei]KOF09796.1 HAD family hydrolase [Planococcus glaciei]MCP2034673.1 phosphoglycolate phosphatase [Planomicrobium sp. HSC-17F08]